MRKTICLFPGLLLPVLLLGWPTVSRAGVYRRVDVSGVIYYTNIPSNPFSSSRVRTSNTSSALQEMIRSAVDRHGVDARLVEAIIAVESNFDPWAVSPKGAMGLMQLMPETARRYAVRNPFDPLQNIAGGIRYLRDLMRRFHGDLPHVLAAYNAGETAVSRYQGLPPYRETREYVRKVLARYRQPPAPASPISPPFRVYRFTGPGGLPAFSNLPPRATLR
ncbi:MAG: lytic transglycosylase domain-containing protein [Candidatus Methylomirabilales bacterium]